MRAPQFAHRPRKASQLTRGKFWCHGICLLQEGQKERRGWLTERFRGSRKMQTLRKDPTQAPRTKAKMLNKRSSFISVANMRCSNGVTEKRELKFHYSIWSALMSRGFAGVS